MSVLGADVIALLDRVPVGTLATQATDGHPRQSLVYFAREDDRILISTVAGRLKVRDVERTGWASLAVRAEQPPYPSATVSGPARILTEAIGPSTATVMQRVAGTPEPPPAQSDEDLAAVGRVLLEIEVDRVGAANYLDQL